MEKTSVNFHEQEAIILGTYLLDGKRPNAQSISLYVQASEMRPIVLSEREEKIRRFILRNPRSTGLMDSALSFQGKSGIRKKILYMSAVLETQPEYADLFLPKPRGWFYNLYIFWVGARAVMKLILGKLVLMFV
jgi:hypothetical protein